MQITVKEIEILLVPFEKVAKIVGLGRCWQRTQNQSAHFDYTKLISNKYKFASVNYLLNKKNITIKITKNVFHAKIPAKERVS